MKKEKKVKSKWLMAFVLIVIIAIALSIYLNIFSIPTGLVAGTSETSETPKTETTTEKKEQPTFTVTGDEIIAKEVTETLPYYEAVNLESGKYLLEVVTDKPVWIRLYDELHFNEWKKYGKHGKVVTGTNLGENDKTDSLSRNFFVTRNHGGRHYLLFLGNEKTLIKFKITQIQKIGG